MDVEPEGYLKDLANCNSYSGGIEPFALAAAKIPKKSVIAVAKLLSSVALALALPNVDSTTIMSSVIA